ncbi:hypothetical protein D3C72_1809090 [compost metagenome]
MAQVGQRLAQFGHGIGRNTHAPGDAFLRAEEIDQHGHLARAPLCVHRLLDQQSRAAGQQHAAVDFSDVMDEAHRSFDPMQPAAPLEHIEEAAQVNGRREGAFGQEGFAHARDDRDAARPVLAPAQSIGGRGGLA